MSNNYCLLQILNEHKIFFTQVIITLLLYLNLLLNGTDSIIGLGGHRSETLLFILVSFPFFNQFNYTSLNSRPCLGILTNVPILWPCLLFSTWERVNWKILTNKINIPYTVHNKFVPNIATTFWPQPSGKIRTYTHTFCFIGPF